MKILNDLYIFNYNQRLWEQPELGGNYPPLRLNVSFACNYPQMYNLSGELIVLGGLDDITYKNTYVDMKLYILSQTHGVNWKLKEENILAMDLDRQLSLDDEDEDMNAPSTVHLSDKEILEEEYSKTESIIHKLKQDVSEMEVNLKQERLKNKNMKENNISNLEKIKVSEMEGRQYIDKINKEIQQLNDRRQCNLLIVSDLLTSLAIKIKHRKFIQARISLIEQSIDSVMEFIIHLDRFFSAAIQRKMKIILENCLDSVIKTSVFNDIVKRKEEHSQILIKFKAAYEELTKDEQKIIEQEEKITSLLKGLTVSLDSILLQRLSDKQITFLKLLNLLK